MAILQVGRYQVQIPHGGRQLGVSKNQREPDDIATVLQVAGRERVTEAMESRLGNHQSLQQQIVGSQRVSLPKPCGG